MAKKQKQASPKKRTKVNSTAPIIFQDIPQFWSKTWLPALILALVGMGLYAVTINYDYVLDDKIVITENKFVKEGFSGIGKIMTTEGFTGFFGEQKNLIEGGRYRPLSLVNFAIEHQFFGLNPKVGHIGNLIWYAITLLILFRVLSMLFPNRIIDKWWFSIPFITTFLFALHPVHSEAVANIKGRDEIMALFFSLATLYGAIKYAGHQKNAWLILTPFLFLLGLLAKENTLTFLAVIPLTLYIFKIGNLKKAGVLMGALIGATVIYILIRYEAIGFLLSGNEPTQIMNNPFLGTSVQEKFATIFYTLILYVKLLFFPHPLTHDYYPYQIPIIGWADPRAACSLVFYFALGIWGLFGLRKRSIPSYAIFFYLFTLSIVSNLFVSVGTTMNERFIFFPSVGFCLLIAYWLVDTLPKFFKEKLGKPWLVSSIILGIMTLGYLWKSADRIPAWENKVTLNRAASKISTGSARAQNFMGVALYDEANTMSQGPEQEAMLREAWTFIEKSLAIIPDYSDALTMKAGITAGLFKYDSDIDLLLKRFDEVLAVKEVPYITTYLKYLNGRNRNVDKLVAFYTKVGTQTLVNKRRDIAAAKRFLNLGLELAPNDSNLRKALQQLK